MPGRKLLFFIITFGCQMNEHDSENLAGMLTNLGFEEAAVRKEADLVIINTCSIRENADKRFFGTLGQLKKMKEKNPEFVACVCGCMMQQEHITDTIKEKYPWVDLIFGTHNIHRFPELLDEIIASSGDLEATYSEQRNALSNQRTARVTGSAESVTVKKSKRQAKRKKIKEIWGEGGPPVENLPSKRKLSHKAYVNIMYGCNNFCTYCIVPYTRGRERSRDSEEILKEVRALALDGVKEITLLGQNVNSYKGTIDFADLIYAINDIEGIERIRFMTSHPKDLSDKLIQAYGDCDKLCKYVHLPIQSGSNRILDLMNRRYTAEAYLTLVEKLRSVVPDIAISTDIIVGFPGETEEDFQETLDLCQRVQFDAAFTFLYSIRKGTPAEKFLDQVHEDVKHHRFNRLTEVLGESGNTKNKAYLGRVVKVLVDGESKKKGMLTGRTDSFKIVNFPGNHKATASGKDPNIGKIVSVRITETNPFSLNGELVESEKNTAK